MIDSVVFEPTLDLFAMDRNIWAVVPDVDVPKAVAAIKDDTEKAVDEIVKELMELKPPPPRSFKALDEAVAKAEEEEKRTSRGRWASRFFVSFAAVGDDNGRHSGGSGGHAGRGGRH